MVGIYYKIRRPRGKNTPVCDICNSAGEELDTDIRR